MGLKKSILDKFIEDYYIKYYKERNIDESDIEKLKYLYYNNPFINKIIHLYDTMMIGSSHSYDIRIKEKIIFWEMFSVIEYQANLLERTTL